MSSARKSSHVLRRIVFTLGAVVGGYGYVRGWPMWSVLLFCLAAPCAYGLHRLFAGRLRRYRFLFFIYVAAGSIGVYEAWHYQNISSDIVESLDLPTGAGEPDLFLETELPQVLYDLFPERAEALLARGFQMKLCAMERAQGRMPSVCAAFQDVDIADIRSVFESALATGSKTDENLQYHYVEVLIRQQAPKAEIDAAVANWRRLFPYSERPDPRDAFGNSRSTPGS